MNIKMALHLGFCFGIKKSVDRAEQMLIEQKESKMYSLGPLMHNTQEVERLTNMGLEVIDTIEAGLGGTVMIRSHGVPEKIYVRAEELGIRLIDCTCPYVKRIHHIVQEHYSKGYQIVIIGSQDHAEVVGIMGWCQDKGICVNNVDDAQKIKGFDKICIVAQTTITKTLWNQATEIIESQNDNVLSINTICDATKDRQDAAIELSKQVDFMIVVGGLHSSNTKKLYEVCKENCKKAIHIENVENLVVTDCKKYGNIGITAGASTPAWIIDKIIFKINEGEVSFNGRQ